MLRHAARGVPWLLVGAASILVALLIEAMRLDPWRLWPLQGVAVGLLAGAAGWCLDEPAAAVVDPAPRSLAWRTLARSTAVGLLSVVWAVSIWRNQANMLGQAPTVFAEGAVACLVAVAWVTARRAAGVPTPGQSWAATIVPVMTSWALLRPLEHHLPIFPFTDQWVAGRTLWGVIAVVAALSLGVTLAESWRFRARTAPSGTWDDSNGRYPS